MLERQQIVCNLDLVNIAAHLEERAEKKDLYIER